jgi:hypothetical protein
MTNRSRLEQMGFSLQFATEDEIALIETLNDTEIELLVKIKSRLDDTAGDVEGHALEGGGIVW